MTIEKYPFSRFLVDSMHLPPDIYTEQDSCQHKTNDHTTITSIIIDETAATEILKLGSKVSGVSTKI